MHQLLSWLTVLLGLVYHHTASGSSFPVLDHITIESKSGPVKGQIIRNGEGHILTQFLGLPFAHPPLGDLRFREPIKHSGWAFQQVLDATSSRPQCHPSQMSPLQQDLEVPDDMRDETTQTSEDCLYLDIHVPGDLRKVTKVSSLQLPVLIELGDGGNGMPSFGKKTWQLATQGDIIVVNVSYRQGVLGYFWLPEANDNFTSDGNTRLKVEGNMGLMDQRLAIHWVWDNILAFGGKPDHITLLGQSEASMYVWLHALTPQSSGMFSRAITHGPTISSPGFVLPPSHVLQASHRLAAHLGCNESTTEVLSCMRKKTVEDLLEGVEEMESMWGVNVDDDIFGQGGVPSQLSGVTLNTAEFLIGTYSRTGRSCAELKHRATLSSSSTLREQIEMEIRELYHYSNVQGSNPDEASSAVILEYGRPCSGDAESIIEDLKRDIYLRSAAERTARFVERTSRTAYLYELIVDSSCVVDSSSSSATQLSAQLLLEKQQLRRQQQQQLWTAWIDFIRYGNPGGEVDESSINPSVSATGSVWSRFNDLTKHCTVIQSSANSSSSSSSSTETAGQQLQQLRSRRMAFWNSYMPYIIQQRQPTRCITAAASSQYTVDRAPNSGSLSSNQFNILVWSFIGVTVLLLLVIVLLLVFLCSARSKLRVKQQLLQDYSVYSSYSSSCWDSCCSCCLPGGGRDTRGEAETRRLRNLPYRDET